MTDKELIYYKRIQSTFIGRQIEEVYYEEIECDMDTEYWEHSTDIHSIDMNIIFRLDNGELIQIIWDNEFYCYGIGFEKINTLPKRENFKTISLADNENWDRLVKNVITKIVVFWAEDYSYEMEQGFYTLFTTGEKTTIKLPQKWQIEFGDEKIWISTLEIHEKEKDNYYWADHLTVFFSKKEHDNYYLTNSESKQLTTSVTQN